MKEVQKKDRQEQINYFLDKVQHFRGLNEFKQLLNFYSPEIIGKPQMITLK